SKFRMKFSYVFGTWTVCYVLVLVECNRQTSYTNNRYLHGQTANFPRSLNQPSWRHNEEENGVIMNPWNRLDKDEDNILVLRSNSDKVKALRQKLLSMISKEAKQLSSNNQSVISIAFLAFGVILFDVLTDAFLAYRPNMVTSSTGGQPQGREALLPGFGLFGDNINNLAEIVLNMLTIYLYRDESPDCGQRLLCESNQQAISRGFLDSLVTYISGFSVSFFLHHAPISRNLEAMRAGRKGQNCIELYPKCSITL
ncbi:hypothetical protein SK128_016794, partial [Halocaridina rubra]